MHRRYAWVVGLLVWTVASSAAELGSKPVLTLELAQQIAQAAEVEARNNEWNVVIAVVDDGGHLIYLLRMDGAQIGSVNVATEKARSSVSFRRPTKAFQDAVTGGNHAILGLPGALPLEGGLPLTVRGHVVGGVGVSGVSSQQDGVIARAGAKLLDGDRD